MDNILIISNLVLWVLVLGLAALVFALTRQIGVLYERVAPAGALMMSNILKVGSKAPHVPLQDLNSGRTVTVGLPSEGRSQLFFFMSPDCPVCKTLLPSLRSAQSAESSWMDVIFASDGDIEQHKQYIQQHNLDDSLYVSSKSLGLQYGVAKLPFAVLIDEQGDITSYGLVNSREHIESLFESKDLGISSIQDYFNAAPGTNNGNTA